MDLKTNTTAALDDWLGAESWDSGEPEDEARFYRFVSEYQREQGFSVNPNELRQLIARTVLKHGHPVGHPQLEAILDHLMSMGCILDFLRATGR